MRSPPPPLPLGVLQMPQASGPIKHDVGEDAAGVVGNPNSICLALQQVATKNGENGVLIPQAHFRYRLLTSTNRLDARETIYFSITYYPHLDAIFFFFLVVLRTLWDLSFLSRA